MNNIFRIIAIALMVSCVMSFTAQAQAGFKPNAQGKKFIASGWHMPAASYIREHITDMEKLPFDGLIIGTFYPYWQNMRDQHDELAKFVTDMKATHFVKFTDNFIGVESGNDGGFDWFDEARCQQLVDNWRTLARAAKQAGMKGLKIDPECYEGPSLYNYETLMHRSTKTPEEYSAQVEKVASQIMVAINEEYPDITLLYYFGPSVVGYPRNLKGWCGMMPAFVDGMIKHAKKGFKIIDGFEQAYGYRTEKQYAEARQKMVDTAKHSAYPSAYRKHVQVGFSYWPDQMAGNPTIGRKSFDAKEISNNYYLPDEVAYAANNSLRYADEYVWMWAESLDIWNNAMMIYDSKGVMHYESVPAAYIDALRRARTGIVPKPPKRPFTGAVTVTVKDLGETDDAVVFGDLWSKYTEVADLPLTWKFMPDEENKGQKAGYFKANYDDTQWKDIRIRDIWDQQGHPELTGYGWYRVQYTAPVSNTKSNLFLAFGAVDESAWVYVNGKLAGVHDIDPDIGFKERFLINVSKFLKPGQVNKIAVKVKNTTGAGGIWRGVKLITTK
ncbi:MAG: hypothetical protein ACYC1M_11480 [Armatimonadota bacterium]